MKNRQKGFVIPLIIVTVVLLVIVLGSYIYTNNKIVKTPVSNPDIVSNASTNIKYTINSFIPDDIIGNLRHNGDFTIINDSKTIEQAGFENAKTAIHKEYRSPEGLDIDVGIIEFSNSKLNIDNIAGKIINLDKLKKNTLTIYSQKVDVYYNETTPVFYIWNYNEYLFYIIGGSSASSPKPLDYARAIADNIINKY